jgi:acyl carrier protein
METSEIKSKIRGIIASMFDVKPEDVQDTKPFLEMAKYDSMRALEFLAKVETEFNVMIDPDLLQKMGTVEASTQVVLDLLHAK